MNLFTKKSSNFRYPCTLQTSLPGHIHIFMKMFSSQNSHSSKIFYVFSIDENIFHHWLLRKLITHIDFCRKYFNDEMLSFIQINVVNCQFLNNSLHQPIFSLIDLSHNKSEAKMLTKGIIANKMYALKKRKEICKNKVNV